MGDIEFACPHCKASLEVEEGAIGTTLDCPGCNRPVVVPTPPVPDPAPHQRVAGQVAEGQPLGVELGISDPARNFVNEGQDPDQVQAVLTKVSRVLSKGEKVTYVSVQSRPAAGVAPGAIVLTNRRFLGYRPKPLAHLCFRDYTWRRLVNVRLTEGMEYDTITLQATNGRVVEMDCLPKLQARAIYSMAQMVRARRYRLRGATCGGVGLCLLYTIEVMSEQRMGLGLPFWLATALDVGLLTAGGVLLALPHSGVWGRWAAGYMILGLLCVLGVGTTQGVVVSALALAIGGLSSVLASLILPLVVHGPQGAPVQAALSRGPRGAWVAMAALGLLTAATVALAFVWVRRYLVLLHSDSDESVGALFVYAVGTGLLLPLVAGVVWTLWAWLADRAMRGTQTPQPSVGRVVCRPRPQVVMLSQEERSDYARGIPTRAHTEGRRAFEAAERAGRGFNEAMDEAGAVERAIAGHPGSAWRCPGCDTVLDLPGRQAAVYECGVCGMATGRETVDRYRC